MAGSTALHGGERGCSAASSQENEASKIAWRFKSENLLKTFDRMTQSSEARTMREINSIQDMLKKNLRESKIALQPLRNDF